MDRLQELLEQFHEIAACPGKQMKHYQQEGKKIIGCVPEYTPEELVHAMGLVPFGLWGGDTEINEAKRYFPAFICSIMQSVLELGMKGKYEGLSAIIIPYLCDSLKCLGENWKCGVKDIPFIPMVYPQNRKGEAGKKFTKASYEKVIEGLKAATGAEFSLDNLEKTIAIYNAHNEAMRRLSDKLSQKPGLTASERSDVFKSAYFMLKEEHTKLVNELIEELDKETVKSKKIRLITTGILADSPNLLRILDENNMAVVGDDVAFESRQYRVDATGNDGMEALVNKFSRMDNCSLLYDPDKKRMDYIVDMVKNNQAHGVIMFLTKFCDPEEFDYALLKERLDEEGIPLIQIEVDRQMTEYQQARTAIETFKEMM